MSVEGERHHSMKSETDEHDVVEAGYRRSVMKSETDQHVVPEGGDDDTPADGPVALLARHPLVASLHDDERALLLPSVHLRDVEAGTRLIDEGDPPGPLLLVLDGEAEVSRRGTEVALVGAGSWVGELALLDDRAARADVQARTRMLLGVVATEDARRVLDLDAVAVQMDSLARRRRSANRAIEVAPVVADLRDGGRVALRPVVASDWHALAEGDGRVSEESLRMRFFNEPPRSERRFRQLTDPDHRVEFAWAAVVDGELVGIGRYTLQAEDRSAAEFALLVADAHQRRGIGRLLVEAIVVAASVHGAAELVAIAREENLAVRQMLDRFGAPFVHGPQDGVVVARWPIEVALAGVGDDERYAALARAARVVLAPVRTV